MLSFPALAISLEHGDGDEDRTGEEIESSKGV